MSEASALLSPARSLTKVRILPNKTFHITSVSTRRREGASSHTASQRKENYKINARTSRLENVFLAKMGELEERKPEACNHQVKRAFRAGRYTVGIIVSRSCLKPSSLCWEGCSSTKAIGKGLGKIVPRRR